MSANEIAGPYSIGSSHWPGTSRLIEEVGELAQVLGKLIGSNGQAEHWDGTDLPQRIAEELGDVQAALEFFADRNGFDRAAIKRRAADKRAKYDQWHTEVRSSTT